MADPRGFMKFARQSPKRRPVELRLLDWNEVYLPFGEDQLTSQAARCMDCGIPFCHQGCPLGNLIPEWNDLVYREDFEAASDRLHATNNFPDFTGRLCPAPCETACVLGINDDPVLIKQIEFEISEKAFELGLLRPILPDTRTSKKVSIVGSGPAGLACAQQLTRAGHDVTVYERADRVGGLLRYGIPEFKMEKRYLERRLDQMKGEGTKFVTSCEIGVDLDSNLLRSQSDALILAGGSCEARELAVPGRELSGVYQAMEFLPLANKVCEGDLSDHPMSANGKKVVILGGGDTGADCLGTVHRQGCVSVVQLEIMPRPPDVRDPSTPWPTWPLIYRVSSAHEEGGERLFSVNTQAFISDARGKVKAIHLHQVKSTLDEIGRFSFARVDDSDFELEADLVLLALGFTGAEKSQMTQQLDLEFDPRGNILRNASWMTNKDGVFVCGDMGRGQSLVVWAIAEGRSCAASVDRFLTGQTDLPSPIEFNSLAIR